MIFKRALQKRQLARTSKVAEFTTSILSVFSKRAASPVSGDDATENEVAVQLPVEQDLSRADRKGIKLIMKDFDDERVMQEPVITYSKV